MIDYGPQYREPLERGLDMVLSGYWACMADVGDTGVRGIVAFDKITATDCELHVFGCAGFLTRGLLRAAGDLVFSAYSVGRVTAHMRASNTKLHKVAERLGFVREGTVRRYYGDEDAAAYGLLKEDFRYVEPQAAEARSRRSRARAVA